MNTDEILKESEEVLKDYKRFVVRDYYSIQCINEIKEKARKYLKLIENCWIDTCGENYYFVGKKRDYVCYNDYPCPSCQEKISQAKKNFEEVLQ